jgi:hypothetical protein
MSFSMKRNVLAPFPTLDEASGLGEVRKMEWEVFYILSWPRFLLLVAAAE